MLRNQNVLLQYSCVMISLVSFIFNQFIVYRFYTTYFFIIRNTINAQHNIVHRWDEKAKPWNTEMMGESHHSSHSLPGSGLSPASTPLILNICCFSMIIGNYWRLFWNNFTYYFFKYIESNLIFHTTFWYYYKYNLELYWIQNLLRHLRWRYYSIILSDL